MTPLGRLFQRLGYVFKDSELIQAALTHRSSGGEHNERLEFLGDAVLDTVISHRLYLAEPNASEGDLSRLRASLVKRDALATVARDLDLGEFIQMGAGELRGGGHSRSSTLADALEAVVGAIYLDGGFAAATEVIDRLFSTRLQQLPDPISLRDPKTRLQELLQSRGMQRPVYQVEAVSGQAHDQQFRVSCKVQALELVAEGSGTSRRRAEQAAASAALEKLQSDDVP